jgi:hypothetical protein
VFFEFRPEALLEAELELKLELGLEMKLEFELELAAEEAAPDARKEFATGERSPGAIENRSLMRQQR